MLYAAATPALFEEQDLFASGDGGYHTYRIPSIIVSSEGVVLAFCEGRKESASDSGDIDLLLRRSTDGGKTWGPVQVLWDDGPNTCGNPCPVVDKVSGAVWLLLTHNLGADTEGAIVGGKSAGTRTVWLTSSMDDGATWAAPVEITNAVKKRDWTWYATGPGIGIQLEAGPHKGRLIAPCDHITAGGKDCYSHIIYSDDHGATWKLGGAVPDNTTNECQVVELADGRLCLNIRNHFAKTYRRAVSFSEDGGLTWSKPILDEALTSPHCQGSIIRFTQGRAEAGRGSPAPASLRARERTGGKNRILFSHPAAVKAREAMTVRLSYDEAKTWPVAKRLWDGPAAYSCLAVLPDNTLACLYERGGKNPYEKITLARFSLGWLTDGADSIGGDNIG
jgi:sialidase-1